MRLFPTPTIVFNNTLLEYYNEGYAGAHSLGMIGCSDFEWRAFVAGRGRALREELNDDPREQ